MEPIKKYKSLFTGRYFALFAFAFMISLLLSSCQCNRNKGHEIDLDGMHVQLPDTLRVGMLNSPTTYFA